MQKNPLPELEAIPLTEPRLAAALSVLPLLTEKYVSTFNRNLNVDGDFKTHVEHIARVAFEIANAFENERINWSDK